MKESDEYRRIREKAIEILKEGEFQCYPHEIGVREIRLYRDYIEDWFKKIEIIACKNKKTIIIEIEKNPTPQHLIGTIGSIDISNRYRIGKKKKLNPLKDVSLFIIIPEQKMTETKEKQIKTIKKYFKIGEGSLKDFKIVTIEEFEKLL